MTNDENQDFTAQLPPETREMFDQVRESLAEDTLPQKDTYAQSAGTPPQAPPSPGSAPTGMPVPPATNTAFPGEVAPHKVQVGLLVWGLILALVGFLMIASAISITGSLQAVLVGGLIVVGVIFLVLAFTTSNGRSTPQ